MKTPSLPSRVIRKAMRIALSVFAAKKIQREGKKKIAWAQQVPDESMMQKQQWIIVQPDASGYPYKIRYQHGKTVIAPGATVKGYAVTEDEAEKKLDVLFAIWVHEYKQKNK